MLQKKWRKPSTWFDCLRRQSQLPTPTQASPPEETVHKPVPYQPLGPNEIRLFRLHPGPNDAVIKLEFLPSSELNDDVPPYHALSYSWGDPNVTQVVQLVSVAKDAGVEEVSEYHATVNLVAFLRHHRRDLGAGVGDGVLWVDAICINQQDAEEKNKQLLLMRQVYEKARSTIVWLGPERKEYEKGLLLIEKAPKVPGDGAMPNAGYNYSEMLVDFNPWLEDEENVALVKDCLLSFLSLLGMPWFSRIWVKQEYIVSTTIKLQYGNRYLSLADLYPVGMMLPLTPKFKTILRSITMKDLSVLSKVMKSYTRLPQIQILDRGRRAYGLGKEALPLLSWLCLFRDNYATDQKDKVYALLGLAGSTSIPTTTLTSPAQSHKSTGYNPELLVINYSHAVPVQDVYKSVVKAVVMATGKIDIIRACQKGGMKGLPSWVPDWSQGWKGAGMTGFFQREIMCASPETREYWSEGLGDEFTASKGRDAEVVFDDDGKRMGVKGVLVDTIGEILGTIGMIKRRTDEYGRNARQWRERGAWGVYGSLEGARNAHWESLTALSNLKIKGIGSAMLPNGGVVKRGATFKEWEGEYEDFVVNGGFNQEFVAMCAVTMIGRQTMVGKKGYMVAGPEGALEGDMVVVLLGCGFPVLLRREGDETRLVGECYCHGVMKGEMVAALEEGTADQVTFELH